MNKKTVFTLSMLAAGARSGIISMSTDEECNHLGDLFIDDDGRVRCQGCTAEWVKVWDDVD